jgi:cytochrome P450
MFNLFNDSLISTSDPLNVQAVLGTQFHDFDLGNDRKFNFGDVLGNGIFTADGAAWTHYRAQLKPQFTRDQVSDLEAAERHLQILFKALPEENAAGWIERVNIMPLLYRFTMDVSTEFLFGRSVNSQSNALYSDDSGNSTEANEEKAFADAMEFAQSYIAWRTRLRGLYWLASSKEFKKACKTIKDFVDKIVATALNDRDRKHAVSTGQKEKYVLMDALVAETDNAVEIRDQTLHILLAGRDTTSALLSWMLLLLSRHPDELQKVRSAILTHFGTEKDPKNEPTFSSLKACKEVQNVIWETLRMYPLVPINGRVALKDTTLPTGGGPDGKQPVVVKKGELVGYSAYVMQRRHDIWGSNADEFVPSRWEGRKLGWEMIAFSGGPRICLGRKLFPIFTSVSLSPSSLPSLLRSSLHHSGSWIGIRCKKKKLTKNHRTICIKRSLICPSQDPATI